MLKPTRGYVLIEVLEGQEETRASGLVMPETAQDKPIRGVVLAVGDSVFTGQVENIRQDGYKSMIDRYDSPGVKEGDKVVFKKWATNDLEEDGKNLAFVKFEDILGVYE